MAIIALKDTYSSHAPPRGRLDLQRDLDQELLRSIGPGGEALVGRSSRITFNTETRMFTLIVPRNSDEDTIVIFMAKD